MTYLMSAWVIHNWLMHFCIVLSIKYLNKKSKPLILFFFRSHALKIVYNLFYVRQRGKKMDALKIYLFKVNLICSLYQLLTICVKNWMRHKISYRHIILKKDKLNAPDMSFRFRILKCKGRGTRSLLEGKLVECLELKAIHEGITAYGFAMINQIQEWDVRQC